MVWSPGPAPRSTTALCWSCRSMGASPGRTPATAYPTAIAGAGAAGLGTAVYAFGGEDWTSQVTTNANKYDMASEAWLPIAPLPAPRTGAGVVTDGTFLYIVNGLTTGLAAT